jgi:uncharacterized damage-inducible protein DinB
VDGYFEMLAAYNRWANERLYDAVAGLAEADFQADHGAFFGSLCGTLNHLLVTDRIWMRRFTGEGPQQTSLDEIVAADRTELRTLRRAEDERIVDFVNGLDAGRLAAPFSYRTITGSMAVTQPLGPALAHLFNHQTHHRGQASVILTRIGGNERYGSLDLLTFQRQTGIGMH